MYTRGSRQQKMITPNPSTPHVFVSPVHRNPFLSYLYQILLVSGACILYSVEQKKALAHENVVFVVSLANCLVCTLFGLVFYNLHEFSFFSHVRHIFIITKSSFHKLIYNYITDPSHVARLRIFINFKLVS